ncbi:MAG: hypothetical protein ACRCXA_02375 [Peptostreptococcaceae bacterium]
MKGNYMMDKILFGELLDRLLYLSNQKKNALAKELGYDVSYISKWIKSKNLPSAKNANVICKDIANFIVNSLNESSMNDIIKYFEFEIDDKDKREELLASIEKNLKTSYLSTVGSRSVVTQETYEQEKNNSINYVNPRLRKRLLTEDIHSYIEKDEVLDIIIYISLLDLNLEEKKALLTAKQEISSFGKKENLKIKFVIGFEYTKDSIFVDSMIILNLISSYTDLEFKIYDCNIARSMGAVSIKDKLLYLSIIRSDGVDLLINTSKDKIIANEFYYSLEKIIKSKGTLFGEEKNSLDMIKDTTYIQHIMEPDLKWIIGKMNEFFMPEDLFIEIAKSVFGEDEELLEELRKINIFLQNITYKSNLKVLIYETEIKRYILSGEVNFFNNPVTLTFEQRARHLHHLGELMKISDNIDIRIINEKIVDEMYSQQNISMILSEKFKIILNDNNEFNSGYVLITNDNFKNMCEELFEVIWEKSEVTDKVKVNFADKICKAVDCMKIVNKENK